MWPSFAQARSSTQRIDSSSSATRILPGEAGTLSGVADISLAHRQGHPETGSAARTWLVSDRAPVLGHDAMAEREAESAAAGLGREEGGEELGHVLGGHAWTRGLDDDRQELPTTAS